MISKLDKKRIAIYALRGFLLYLVFAVFLNMTAALLHASGIRLPGMGIYSSANISEDLHLPVDFAFVLHILVIPFLYYTVARAFMLSDPYGYEVTEQLDADDRRVRFSDVLGTPAYLITLGASVLGYIVLPLSLGFRQLASLFGFGAVLGVVTEKILFGIPLVLCFALLLALAAMSARREWQRIRKERAHPDADKYKDIIAFFKNKTGIGGLIGSLFLAAWLYPIGTFATSVLTAVLLPFILAMVSSPKATLIGISIIISGVLLFLSPSFIRAFFKRRTLMRRLKKVCRTCGYELTLTGHPYLNLIRYRGGADFSVKVGERQYDCKLLGAIMPGGKMLFGYDGKVEIHHYIRFFWAARAMHTVTSHTFEQSTFHTELDYSFESDHQKVLIVCPAAPQTFIAGAGGGSPIDTGAHIGDYRMFNTTGFLGALERDCLDR